MKRIPAAAVVVLLAMFAASCAGVRPKASAPAAAGHPPKAGEVRLVISRDFGAQVLVDVVVPYKKGLDAMRLLAEHATVDAGYGGRFVNAINGLKSSFGGVSSADAADWFYWVDGTMADVGAADWKLNGGETVWWDYHKWQNAMLIPATIDAFPAPWNRGPLTVTSDLEPAALEQWAAANGLRLGDRRKLAAGAPDGGLVIATAAQAEASPWLAPLLAPKLNPALTLILEGGHLSPADGRAQTPILGAVLALPNPAGGQQPVLVVIGDDAQAIDALLPQITADVLRARVAVASVGGGLTPLPLSTMTTGQ